MTSTPPILSVVIPTFNNVAVLTECLQSWEAHAGGQPVEVIVVEDGCRDATPAFLASRRETAWGRAHLRSIHLADLHELRCTNAGMREARGALMMAWQDDMFLEADWFVPELIATFEAYADLGLLCLSRGLNCYPLEDEIRTWEDLMDERRLASTIGPRPLNWFRIQEVDGVIRPWVVRRGCTNSVGLLDEAFVPTEWDETDLCFRIREAGWRIATHGYERLGAYRHLGSSTLGALSDKYKQGVLRNGRLFHDRWDATIRATAYRPRRTWWRRTSAAGWAWTVTRAARALGGRR
ncbi:MAG: glycosyltransferase family 2 protein [Vicinamibacterales bacterium]